MSVAPSPRCFRVQGEIKRRRQPHNYENQSTYLFTPGRLDALLGRQAQTHPTPPTPSPNACVAVISEVACFAPGDTCGNFSRAATAFGTVTSDPAFC